MAVANMPFPSFLLPCPGEPAMPFGTWLRIFDYYLRVIDATGDAWPDDIRTAVLLHCLGTEGQRIFYSLPNRGTTYKDAEAALKAYFVPKANIVAERHAFCRCCQAPHETVIQYVAALRELVVTCEFGACADDMIRDQSVENVLSPRIRERLLLEIDLTLDRAVTIASQIESAADHAKSSSNCRQVTAPVQAVQHVKCRRAKSLHAPPTSVNVEKRKSCFRCGSEAHLANAANCPAATATCRKCKKTGHYAKVCRSTQSNTREVHEIELPEVTVLYTESPAHSPSITSTVTISTSADQACVVNLVLNTGSSDSILPHST